MIKAYQDGKDVYVEIASLAYNVPYEECLENRPDGTTNPEGKARRGSAKSIVLGILYGRQVSSIAEQLNVSTKEAQKIYDKVLGSFPELHQFIKESTEMARKNGWVETIWGRRRQLPEMQLPQYEFEYVDGVNPDFDPLSDDDEEISTEVPQHLVLQYTKKLNDCRSYKQKMNILDSLTAQGISIKDNTMKITDAERQCVNCVDFETEILTTSGWKKYNEVKQGDSILSYNIDTQKIVQDTIQLIHIQKGNIPVYKVESPKVSIVCTDNHRWVVQTSSGDIKICMFSELKLEDSVLLCNNNTLTTISTPLSTCSVSKQYTKGVWCVTTGNGTWIARRDGCVYITGNSRVQGKPKRLNCPSTVNFITQRCIA